MLSILRVITGGYLQIILQIVTITITRGAFASVQCCKIWVRVIIRMVVIVTEENKVKSYFIGFAQYMDNQVAFNTFCTL